MPLLITGGLGYTGSWIVHELAACGEPVFVWDGTLRPLDYLEPYADRIHARKVDMLDLAGLAAAMREIEGKVEGIIHLAGLMGGPAFVQAPHRNVQINLLGTLNMLEVARIYGVRRFVYVSSGAVYGSYRNGLPDEDAPMNPADLYGSTKASAELIGRQYAGEFGIDFRVARIYFVYGPGRLPSELYPLYRFLFGALEGISELSLPNGRDQQLDFTYVRDAARGILSVCEAEELENQTFNISSGVVRSVPEMLEIVLREAPVRPKISLGPGVAMPRSPGLNIERARRELGFRAEYDFERGVKEYAEWIRRQMER